MVPQEIQPSGDPDSCLASFVFLRNAPTLVDLVLVHCNALRFTIYIGAAVISRS
jgi:hypothetical protein